MQMENFEKSIEASLRTDRRALLKKGAILMAGIASAQIIDAQSSLFRPLDEPIKDFKYLSKSRYFVPTVEKAVRIFWNSVAQEQAAIYQLPFRYDVVLGDHLKYLDSTERVISGLLTEERNKPKAERDRLHRLVAYPAIVAAHLIPHSDSIQEIERLQQVLETIYAGAVSQTFGSDVAHNDIRDIVAQNCTASLISSPEAWQRFTVNNSLIELMRAVIAAFLSSTEGERHMHAAATAYQFLLSYQTALGERSSKQQWSLIDAIRRDVNEHGSPRATWLRALDRLYSRLSTFELQMPQLTELVIGRNLYLANDPRRGATHLFTAMRLYMNAIRFVRSDRRTDDEANIERQTLIASKRFLAEVGVDKTAWRETITTYLAREQIDFAADYIEIIDSMYRDAAYSIPESTSHPAKTLWHKLRAPFGQFSEPNLAAALLGVSVASTPTEALWSAFGSLAKAQKTVKENLTRLHSLTLRSFPRNIPKELASDMQNVSARSFEEWVEAYTSEPSNRQTMQVIETAMNEALGATHVAPRGHRVRSDRQEQPMKHLEPRTRVSRETLREFYDQNVGGTSNQAQYDESRRYLARRKDLLARLDLARFAREGHRFIAINLETENYFLGQDSRSVETQFVREFGPQYGKLHIEQIAR